MNSTNRLVVKNALVLAQIPTFAAEPCFSVVDDHSLHERMSWPPYPSVALPLGPHFHLPAGSTCQVQGMTQCPYAEDLVQETTSSYTCCAA